MLKFYNFDIKKKFDVQKKFFRKGTFEVWICIKWWVRAEIFRLELSRAEPSWGIPIFGLKLETELTIWKQIFQISQFCFCIMISINFMIFFWIYVAHKVHNLDIFRTILL